VLDICRELGISNATFYKWRTNDDCMVVSMMSRMKELEDENLRLKEIYRQEKLKAETVAEALEKKVVKLSRRIEIAINAVTDSGLPIRESLQGVFDHLVLLSLRVQARCRESICFQLAHSVGRQPPQLRLCPVLHG
jgi:putative transposase